MFVASCFHHKDSIGMVFYRSGCLSFCESALSLGINQSKSNLIIYIKFQRDSGQK
jgi:hypothetical protein